MHPFDPAELNRLIRTRRSVYPKQYTGEQIPRAVIEQMLENANWAPTHAKTEPWRFFVFAGEKLKVFGEWNAEVYRRITAPEKFDQAKYDKFRANPLTASHVIAICMKRQPNARIPVIEDIEAVACAVQNMYLTVTAYGYGGFWSSAGATYTEEAKEYFGLGTEDQVLGFFYAGVPNGPVPDGVRGPIQDKTVWVE
jgi:nitroreductase